MQQCFMFIDTGNGWTPVNDSAKDVAALDSFTIDWGSDSIDEQPEPAVMTFTLRDKTGRLAGQALTLAGMKRDRAVLRSTRDGKIFSRRWAAGKICASRSTRCTAPTTPDSPESTDSSRLYDVRRHRLHRRQHRTGQRRRVAAQTLRHIEDGRVEAPAIPRTDRHGREMGRRALDRHAISTPQGDEPQGLGAGSAGSPTGRARPAVKRRAIHDHPTTHRSSTCCTGSPPGHDSRNGMRSTTARHPPVRPLFLADPVSVHLSTDGRLNVLAAGATRHALSAADIEASTDLSITEPLTQVVINAKRVKSDNGKLSFDDVEITMGDQNRLPPQLTAMQKSLTIDSDMLAVDDSGGVWNSGGTSNVSDTDRANIAQWLESHDLRMVPETATFNSTRIDPARFPWLYKASPSGPFIIVKAKASALTGSDGRPAFTGPITTIGGTLSYRWRNGKPTLTQAATLTALRPLATNRITWADLPSGLSWQQLDLHICDLSMIQIIDASTIDGKEGTQ